MTPITHPGERGTMTDLQMVRLADEGVPIRALVRVFRRPFDEVERLLKEARDEGTIIDLPAADWPADTRRDTRVPTPSAARGDAPIEFVHALRSEFRLTSCEATLLGVLVWKGRASKAALHEIVSNEAEPKIIDVFVCKLRKKLAPYQLDIGTVWGWGYTIAEDVRGAIVTRLRTSAISPVDVRDLVSAEAPYQ